ncbi:DMT family transporter [Paracoccus aestuariivivens]|uniref:EamA-like transporter family protein n=1 Tax=Paracoccus aestuariivivens TaxID=1820333 RepID=A0A6L6J7I4_9RHOB|nr:DMT family transporter [Paracoccus aestuariivivens]MTH78073.1 EamA-like transporter family protein [Paracoccus aestuariivivens]
MALIILLAFGAGMLITLSRQINGRLAIETSALQSSFWNHLVGFAALAIVTMVAGSFWPEGAGGAPWFAWIGGIMGVAFVGLGSWLIPRLGAAMTGALLVAGQMLTGVVLDLARGQNTIIWMQIGGVILILLGVFISRKK